MTDTTAPIVIPSVTKSFRGGFLLYRKAGSGLVKPGHKSQSHNPRFRHPTFAAAEAEANRLLPSHPESTFIIMQEVATVKAAAAPEPKIPRDGDDAQVFEAHAKWVRDTERGAVRCDGCRKLVDASTTKRWADDAETCPDCSPPSAVIERAAAQVGAAIKSKLRGNG